MNQLLYKNNVDIIDNHFLNCSTTTFSYPQWTPQKENRTIKRRLKLVYNNKSFQWRLLKKFTERTFFLYHTNNL